MLLVCALLSSLVIAATGDDPEVPAGPSRSYNLDAAGVLPNLVTVKDVLTTPEDSPARSILRAFQATQFKDVSGLRSLISHKRLQRTPGPVLAKAVQSLGPALGRPVVMSTRTNADRAIARIVVLSYLGRARRPAQARTYTIPLRRVAGRWLLEALDFILEPAAELRAARERR